VCQKLGFCLRVSCRSCSENLEIKWEGGGGVLPIMDFTGMLRPKGVHLLEVIRKVRWERDPFSEKKDV